jgi:hypothetical protein
VSISVRCECGKTLVLRDEAAGKSFGCPACGAPVTVPHAGARAIPRLPEPVMRQGSPSPQRTPVADPAVVLNEAMGE